MVKKLIASCLLALGARAIEIGLEVDPIVVEPGELVMLNIVASGDLSQLRGYTLDLEYRTAQIDLFSVIEGDIMIVNPPTYLYWQDDAINGYGIVHVDHAILGDTSGGEGPGTLIQFLWEARECGLGEFALENIQLRDLQNQPLTFAYTGDVLHQICQVPPLQIEWQPDNSVRLFWDPVLNANQYLLDSRTNLEDLWQPLVTVADTSWIDPASSGLPMRLYRLRIYHD